KRSGYMASVPNSIDVEERVGAEQRVVKAGPGLERPVGRGAPRWRGWEPRGLGDEDRQGFRHLPHGWLSAEGMAPGANDDPALFLADGQGRSLKLPRPRRSEGHVPGRGQGAEMRVGSVDWPTRKGLAPSGRAPTSGLPGSSFRSGSGQSAGSSTPASMAGLSGWR